MSVNETATQYTDANMAEPVAHDLGVGEAVVITVRSPDKETANEDAAAIFPVDANRSVLVVADGMGGPRAGEHAAEAVIQEISKSIAKVEKDDMMLRTAILDGIEKAGEKIRAKGVGAGSTVVALQVKGSTVRPYHAGDSCALIVGGRGTLKLQTVSHSPVGLAVEAGVMNEKEAMQHEDRHLVTNAVGLSGMRIEIGAHLDLAPLDTVVVASDGLFDNLRTNEIVECIRKGPLVEGVAKLAADARERMIEAKPDTPSKPDDLTVIAFRLKS